MQPPLLIQIYILLVYSIYKPPPLKKTLPEKPKVQSVTGGFNDLLQKKYVFAQEALSHFAFFLFGLYVHGADTMKKFLLLLLLYLYLVIINRKREGEKKIGSDFLNFLYLNLIGSYSEFIRE